jgi:hypothetical protein
MASAAMLRLMADLRDMKTSPPEVGRGPSGAGDRCCLQIRVSAWRVPAA